MVQKVKRQKKKPRIALQPLLFIAAVLVLAIGSGGWLMARNHHAKLVPAPTVPSSAAHPAAQGAPAAASSTSGHNASAGSSGGAASTPSASGSPSGSSYPPGHPDYQDAVMQRCGQYLNDETAYAQCLDAAGYGPSSQ